jgi:hypothetical protein
MEHLLSVLHPSCPAKADALCKTRRRVEHGLTTVGLKIHCLGDNWEPLNLITHQSLRVFLHNCFKNTELHARRLIKRWLQLKSQQARLER